MKTKFQNNIFLYLSFLSFFLSLVIPIDLEGLKDFDGFGFVCLIYGLITFPEIDFYCWSANLFIILAWILNKKKLGFVFSLISFFLMLSYGLDYLLHLNIYEFMDYDQILLAYWFWLLSATFLLINFIRKFVINKKNS